MIKPMLAFHYNPSHVSYPCFVQPKLNGVRGIYDPRSPHFQSRNGERWSKSVVNHALSSLTKLGNVFLDGEFYRHGMSLQEINSRISVVRSSPHAESSLISFHVFDIITRLPFWKRAELLKSFSQRLEGDEYVNFVETREVASVNEAEYWYNQWKHSQGYEGMMYRASDADYGLESQCRNKENRWRYLQKRKECLDMDVTVVGLLAMIDNNTQREKDTLGAFELMTDTGITFAAGSGLTNMQRSQYWQTPELLMGRRIHIEYEMLSDTGVPLKPIIACVYE